MLSISSFKIKPGLPRAPSGGFTLVEMMVVIAIMLIITGVVLSNLPNFRDRLSLDLIAQEVAITIRQAQVFGSGTRTSGANAFPSYGVYFDTAHSDNFILFADLGTPNDRYDATAGCQDSDNECREQFNFTQGVQLVDLQSCISEACTSIGGNILNVAFRRPLTDAIFSNAADPLSSGVSSVIIKIAKTSKIDDTRSIVVWNTGHIYVIR